MDGADFCTAVSVAIDLQKGGVDWDGFRVEYDGFNADEIFRRFFPRGGDAGGADRVDEEWGIGEGFCYVDVL